MGRIKELDGLRGIAVVVILLFHLRAGGAFALGWAAVDVFFVLSGYLITSIILRHLDSPKFLTAFYLRRGLRIWPAYFLALGLLVVMDQTLGERQPLGYLPPFLTFTQGLSWFAGRYGVTPSYFGHTWTLAMEEQFYLIWPALVVICGRRFVVPLAALVAAASVGVRTTGYTPILLISRCDGFAIGSMLAAVLADPTWVARRGRSLAVFFAAAIPSLAVYVVLREFIPASGLRLIPGSTLLALNLLFGCVVGLIVVGGGSRPLAFLRSRPLSYLGKISYGLYLYHALTYYLVLIRPGRFEFVPTWMQDAFALGATWLAAAASWRYLEAPLLALKDRVPYEAGRFAARSIESKSPTPRPVPAGAHAR